MEDFGSILGPHLGISCDSFGASFFDVFMRWLLGGVFTDLGSIWGTLFGTCFEACLKIYLKRDMHERIRSYNGFAMSEPSENLLF